MNIFVLSKDPRQAARMHADAHVVKMILETAQILSTVWRLSSKAVPPGTYRATHRGHPATVWAGTTPANYLWLAELGAELCREFAYRFGHTHASAKVLSALQSPPALLYFGVSGLSGLTPFVQIMPDEFRREDTVEAYRNYYITAKAHLLRYTRRHAPPWIPIGGAEERP